MDIRKRVVQGMKSVRFEPTEAAIESVMQKLAGRDFAKQGYAYRAGRNYAIEQMRRAERKPRIKLRELERELKRLRGEVERLSREQLKANCLKEFERVCEELRPTLKCSQPQQLQVLKASVFDGATGTELTQHFGITEDCAYQYKRRAVRLIWPHVSVDFRRFLGVKNP